MTARWCSMVTDDSLLGQYLRLETPVGPVTRRGLFLWVIDKPRVSRRQRAYVCCVHVCVYVHVYVCAVVRDRRLGLDDDNEEG